MRLQKQTVVALVISIVCAACFGYITYLVSADHIIAFDHALIAHIQGLESTTLTHIMTFFTLMGDKLQVVILSIVIIILLYFVLHHRRQLLVFMWVSGGSVILNTLLKDYYQRPRPTLYRLADATGYSFPSGHAMAALSLYGVLAFLLWHHMSHVLARMGLLLMSIVMIGMIGISRIYLGVHYPSDIMAGFSASGCWLALSIWLYQRFVVR